MSSILLTIDTPEGPVDLSVPAQVTVQSLLAMLTPDATDLSGWTVRSVGGTALEPTRTLEEAGVLDGARLALTPAGILQTSPVAHAPATRVAAADRASRVIPDRTATAERVVTAFNALLGRHRPAGARGPIDRMRQAWAWTEHRRRLEWLLTRPRMHKPIVIGVVGHRSDDLAESLADTLAASRLERVVLVDGGPTAAISRRLREAGSGIDAIESGLRRRDVTSIERDLLFGRTELGTLAVPIETTVPPPDAATMRRLCNSLPTHAGLIVVDCGPQERPNAAMLERCDQIVASSTGSVPRLDAQTILALWGGADIDGDRDLYAVHDVSGDETSVLELAVVVASGWVAIDAATPVPLGL